MPPVGFSVMNHPRRRLMSVTVGVVAFVGAYLFLFLHGCADVLGMSSWERCTTVVGTPAFSLTDWGLDNTFDMLIPLFAGILGAVVAWWLDRPPAEDRGEYTSSRHGGVGEVCVHAQGRRHGDRNCHPKRSFWCLRRLRSDSRGVHPKVRDTLTSDNWTGDHRPHRHNRHQQPADQPQSRLTPAHNGIYRAAYRPSAMARGRARVASTTFSFSYPSAFTVSNLLKPDNKTPHQQAR